MKEISVATTVNKIYYMTYFTRLFSTFLMFMLLSSQNTNEGWQYCQSPIPEEMGGGYAEVVYYDPDEDCFSNEWLINFHWGNSESTLYTDEDWRESEPSTEGWYSFDFGNWDCCNDDNPVANSGGDFGSGGGFGGGGSGGFGGGGGDPGCFLAVDCGNCTTVEAWLTCGIGCEGC
jgi:uncharacterized membrane protein YgcG